MGVGCVCVEETVGMEQRIFYDLRIFFFCVEGR